MAQSVQEAALPLMVMDVSGRLDEMESSNGTYYNGIKVPSASQYDSPAFVIVRSKRPLGRRGEEVSCRVTLSGFKRTFERKDGSRGVGCDLVLTQVDA